MGLFDHFPYTNVHELNLDWVLSMMKALEAEWEAFTAGNSLTFADPLQHDSSNTYAKNTIVLDAQGNAYVSLQAVPVGVALGNQDYWLMVFDYEAFIEKVNSNFTYRYYRNDNRAKAAISSGDWLTLDDVLYKATANIAYDELLEDGVNITHFTLEDFIKQFMQSATNLINQYKADIDSSEATYRAELAADVAATVADLQAQFNAAIAGVTVDSEVINARVGSNGRTYSTLEERLNSQFELAYNELNFLNCGNILDVPDKSYTMSGGGTATFKNCKIIINGIASSEGWFNIFTDSSAFFGGLNPGDSFTARLIEPVANTIIGQVYYYISGNWVIATEGVIRDVAISYTIPATATGILLRFTVVNGTYSNFTAGLFISNNNVKTNKELEQMIIDSGYYVATLPINSDLNAVNTTGAYLLAYNYNYSNCPVDAGVLFHTQINNPAQIVYQLAGSAMYYRYYTGAGWIDWRTIKLTPPALKKKIAMFGDSITWGRDGNLPTPTQVGGTIPKIVSWTCDQLDADNYGEGGMGWISTAYNTDTAYDKLSATDLTGYDVVTFMFGVNDYYQTIGTYEDDENDNTIMGQIYKCMNYVKTNYPDIACVLISMPNATNFKNTPYGGFPAYDYEIYNLYANSKRPKDLHDEMVLFADRYHIPFIDLNHCGITSFNITRMLPDNVHPSQDGYFLLGGYIAGELNRILG